MSTQIESQSLGEQSRSSRLPLIGILLVQVFIGYEWFMSGLTKIVDGGFPSGLAADLADRSKDSAGWYKSFLDGSIIPNAQVFGYLIEIGEIVVGVALIAAGLVWLFRWEKLPRAGQVTVLLTSALAALAGIVMAINFHLANGSSHPWLIPASGFDESVDLDSLLPAFQLLLIVVSVGFLRSLRRTAPRRASIARSTADDASS